MTTLPETDSTAVPLPADSPAEPAIARKKVTRAAVKRAAASLELLQKAGKLPSRNPTARALRRLERKIAGSVRGKIDGLRAIAIASMARTTTIRELVDGVVLYELASPVHKGRRALHAVTRERAALAELEMRQLVALGLSPPQAEPESENTFLAGVIEANKTRDFWGDGFAERMAEARKREDEMRRQLAQEPSTATPALLSNRHHGADLPAPAETGASDYASFPPEPPIQPAPELLPPDAPYRPSRDVTPAPRPTGQIGTPRVEDSNVRDSSNTQPALSHWSDAWDGPSGPGVGGRSRKWFIPGT